MVIGSTGVLNITATTGLPLFDVYTFDAASTVNFGASGNQTIENSATYGNLTTSGSGTKTLESSGGTMNFAGTITIGSGTTLASNNKTMNVGGGFINNGTFTRGTSTVVLDGSAEQEIGGSTSTIFTNLTVNNSSLTGITVSNDFRVAGTLTLTDGIVNTSAGNYVQIDDNATVSGASTDSHVKGPIRKAGNDAFTFPIGSGTLYSPLTITAPNETGDIFEATYVRSSGAVLGSISVSGLTQVSNCEYWDLQEVTDPGNDNTLTVTIGWYPGSGCGSGYITDYTKITLAHFNGTNWSDFGGVPSGNNTTGTVQRTGVSSFSPFTLGSTEAAANPLPVSFSDVKAFEKGNAVQIDWTNLTESDVESYVIERSANGVDFTAIASVAPRSNQVDRVSYSYLDMAPLSGTNFYRIKAVELDGKTIYTKNLRVDIGRSPKGISLYPNPVKGQNLTIGFSAARGMYNLQVVNNGGQVVYRQQMNHNGGTISQQLNLPASLKSGVYSLLISGDNYKESRMFVVQQ
ncbi:MAG: T9SS type A sorting domain-containing protein [Chitinophagaceae bacterium]|nr:T9SS type A sorting domain-containing protein [Chitinophagaceae bacterium]